MPTFLSELKLVFREPFFLSAILPVPHVQLFPKRTQEFIRFHVHHIAVCDYKKCAIMEIAAFLPVAVTNIVWVFVLVGTVTKRVSGLFLLSLEAYVSLTSTALFHGQRC